MGLCPGGVPGQHAKCAFGLTLAGPNAHLACGAGRRAAQRDPLADPRPKSNCHE
jgi:hypothetical protein